MIAKVTGRLEHVAAGSALVDVGAGVSYEVLVAAADVERLARRCGQEVALHTIHYLEGDMSRGAAVPRLIGFLSESDRDFFRIFTTVKGIGARKALRALVRSPGEVAAAIGAKDVKYLKALPEIGPRTAERIVAELHGKLDEFAGEAAAAISEVELPEAGAEAVAVLVQLGERRADATALVERVLAVAPDAETPEEIIQHAYRLKAGGT
jgi:holliday junction DNA helicase RuvA